MQSDTKMSHCYHSLGYYFPLPTHPILYTLCIFFIIVLYYIIKVEDPKIGKGFYMQKAIRELRQ